MYLVLRLGQYTHPFQCNGCRGSDSQYKRLFSAHAVRGRANAGVQRFEWGGAGRLVS